jgi:hypothetical protein
MPAGLPTVADLRRAGRITSQEVVAAIDAYMHNPAIGPYRFASGHSVDVAAIVNALPALAKDGRCRPKNAEIRIALAAAIMAAHPTPP